MQEKRYLAMVKDVGYAARRQGVNGLHVHVGVETADGCYERLEAVLPWLPVVLALSANSPFVEGDRTGMQSTRAFLLAELPRAGAPPAFGSYAAWEAWVERLSCARRHRGLHAHLVGRASASALRHARGAHRRTSRPRSSERRCSRRSASTLVERAAPRPAIRPRAATTPEPLGGGALRASRRELIHPDGDRVVLARSLAAELARRRSRPQPEALRQLEVATGATASSAVAADLVGRTLG